MLLSAFVLGIALSSPQNATGKAEEHLQAEGGGRLTQEPAGADNIAALGFPAAAERSLRQAMSQRNYHAAETILLDQLKEDTGGGQQRSLLIYLGGVYFLAGDFFQAAVAWKKAAAVMPLPPDISFSLAMAYVQMGHSDWGTSELMSLHAAEPANALYPFWLGRLDYDRQLYTSAIRWFRAAIGADRNFAKAHDNLGLCLYYINDVDGAIAEYRRAIDLEAGKPGASAWPYLNLGIAEEFRGNLQEAVSAFRRAIDLDPKFAQAHYRLGNTYVSLDRIPEAISALQTAAAADSTYAEPHVVLARLYRRQGDIESSKREVELYRALHEKAPAPKAVPQ